MSKPKDGFQRGVIAKAMGMIAASSGLTPPPLRIVNGTRSYKPTGSPIDMSDTIFEVIENRKLNGQNITELRPILGPGVKMFIGHRGLPFALQLPNGQVTHSLDLQIPALNIREAFDGFEDVFRPVIEPLFEQYKQQQKDAKTNNDDKQEKIPDAI